VPPVLAAWLIIGFWVVVALALVLIALGGGPSQARERLLAPRTKAARRFYLLGTVVIFAGFGVVVPGLVIAENEDSKRAGNADIKLSASERRGRELFGQTCHQCHTLAAAGTVGKAGPNLDELKPPKSLVLDAIVNGRARGIGRMPAGLLQGKDAEDVAAFVARVAGRQ
jgi:cytochrome c551